MYLRRANPFNFNGMSITDLNNTHLTEPQMEAIKQALTALETAMASLQVNLTPEERNRYGRVNEQNKLFVGKVNEYALSEPALRSQDVDWDEFAKDFKSRNFLEGIINRLNSLSTRANNAKTLHDYDNYQDALADYAYTSFRVGSKAVGFEDKHKELKQFFKRRNRNTTVEPPKEGE